mgnify:CR=1 FL=1
MLAKCENCGQTKNILPISGAKFSTRKKVVGLYALLAMNGLKSILKW